MTVADLIAQLQVLDPNADVVVREGKYGYIRAGRVQPGFFFKAAGEWQPDVEEEGGTDSVLIS
jgi:hypothetical protein